nr:DNA-processing protein DprA [Marinicella rhabdoformis]
MGIKKATNLLQEFGDAKTAIKQKTFPKTCQIPTSAVRYLQNASADDIQAELSWLEKPHNHILPLNDPLYPPQLRQIDEPPLLLFVKGQPEVLLLPQLAVVGSRNATQGGLNNTQAFCQDLSQKGFVITSGLAAGIDATAHQAALDAQGQTIAVMGTGINQIYPKSNQNLAKAIVQAGAVVSELPFNTPPHAHNFPRRNRIIAGLSLGTLVVEAAIKSGTLITARLSMEQNRPVMAIPGSIHNPHSKGCHALIKQGAKLVESAQDIAEELTTNVTMLSEQIREQLQQQPNENLEKKAADPICALPESQQLVLQTMGYDPISFDDLAAATDMSVAALNSDLMLLELSDWITKSAGSQYQRVK